MKYKKLYKLFKIKLPEHAGTLGYWSQWERDSSAASPFGFWFIRKAMPRLEYIAKFGYVADAYHWFCNKISNIQGGCHTLRTNVRIGNFSDVDYRMEQAVFNGLIDFIEAECFENCFIFSSTMLSAKLQRYAKLPRFIQLFINPVKNRSVRREMGLRFFMMNIEDRSNQDAIYELVAAYNFAVDKWENDKYTNDLFHKKNQEKTIKFGIDEIWIKNYSDIDTEYFKKIDEYDQEVTQHLMTIIKNRKYLWT